MPDVFVMDPDSSGNVFTVVWCDKDGTNDGSANDDGDLQGATLTAAAAQVPTGLTLDSENRSGTTIRSTVYAINTCHNILLSGGTAGVNYSVTSRVTMSDGRTNQDKTIIIKVRET